MTRSAVQGYINAATHALHNGQCNYAGETIQAGYQALQDYAGALAAAGESPAATIRFHNVLARLHVKQQRCAASGGLSGPLDRDNLFPTIGFLFGLIGLGIGFGTIYKNS